MRILREFDKIYLFNQHCVPTEINNSFPYNTHIALNYSFSRLKNKVANVTFGIH